MFFKKTSKVVKNCQCLQILDKCNDDFDKSITKIGNLLAQHEY